MNEPYHINSHENAEEKTLFTVRFLISTIKNIEK